VNWRDLQEALHNYRVLSAISDHISPLGIEIESFNGGLRAEGLTIPRGGGAPPLLDRVSFELSPGECLVIVGGSGAGKTSLLRALSGLVPAPIGSTFFDESELRALGPEALYRITGYLPQRADLVPGSIAENISCFEQERHDDRVIEAAKSAGVHGLLLLFLKGTKVICRRLRIYCRRGRFNGWLWRGRFIISLVICFWMNQMPC
jgi:ABC-type protease/lipase transport system fused ATPase/permease subunit